MGKAADFREVDISELKPYERNAKIHSRAQIEKLGACMRRVGFINPVLIDREMNVIAGHGRIMAAREIGLQRVPCVFVDGLTEEQRRAYILEDNRLAEMSEWDMETVSAELRDLFLSGFDISPIDFDIEIPEMDTGGGLFGAEGTGEDGSGAGGDGRGDADGSADGGGTDGTGGDGAKGKAWKTRGMRCDMKPAITAREKSGCRYVSLYAVSKEGRTLEEIKNSRDCERQMAEELTRHIRESMGGNLSETGWAMITTGRRRHRSGYHFATEVCRRAAQELRVPFYESAIECRNANRLKPDLVLTATPAEKNLILFDDIITTGTTMARTTELLQKNGFTVIVIIGIRNQ